MSTIHLFLVWHMYYNILIFLYWLQ
jgi:hypothetical protein